MACNEGETTKKNKEHKKGKHIIIIAETGKKIYFDEKNLDNQEQENDFLL